MSVAELIKQRLDTNLLRFIAMIAVVNSHLDFLYPQGYKILATGGAIGNSLFFFTSGFGLWFGIKKLDNTTFTQWFSKRCARIYPAYLVVLPAVLSLLYYTGDLSLFRAIDVGKFIFFPHGIYWFLQAMILFYIVIYGMFSLSKDKEKVLLYSIFLSIFLYLGCYFYIIDLSIFSIESHPFKLIFYFICILLGMALSYFYKNEVVGSLLSSTLIALSLLLFFTSKFYMKNNEGFEYQGIQHLAILLFMVSLFSLSRTNVNLWLRKSKTIAYSVDYISSHTLEIYIVHIPLILFMKWTDMDNVFYIVPLIISTLFLSSLLKKIATKLSKRLGI